MRLRIRAGWAVAASVAIHATIVALASLSTRGELPSSARPALDTCVRIGVEPMRDVPVPVQVAVATDPEPVAEVEEHRIAESHDVPFATDGQYTRSTPRIASVPSSLPDSVLAHVRRVVATPAPISDPVVRPAAAVTRPVHGALTAGQRVVYLLDASGSMGEWGKFSAARDALAATAAAQPTRVEVKVVVYAASAEVVTPTRLASCYPAGRGDHLAGLRLALDQKPDFVVWFTDASDLPTAGIRTQLRLAGKPVTLVTTRVGPTGVAAPVEFR
ncbi:MAG: hypothetical protein U0804_16290 [Gemmataceae bacterium]